MYYNIIGLHNFKFRSFSFSLLAQFLKKKKEKYIVTKCSRFTVLILNLTFWKAPTCCSFKKLIELNIKTQFLELYKNSECSFLNKKIISSFTKRKLFKNVLLDTMLVPVLQINKKKEY